MKRVGIVADSAVNIPANLIKKYGIRVVPLRVQMDNKSYRDTIDIKTPDELFGLAKKAEILPTTSASPPTDYLEIYRKLGEKTNNILYIAMSSRLSMSFNAATLAKEAIQIEKPAINVEVFDSMTTIGAMGLIVLAAARVAAKGKNMEAVIKAADSVKARVSTVYAMNAFPYPAGGGRISKTIALVGNTLSLKPIVEISTSKGVPTILTRVRTSAKAVEQLLEIMERRVGKNNQVHIMIEHTCAPGEAEMLRDVVKTRFNCAEVLLSEYNPAASVTVGPKVIGLDFYCDDN